LPLKRLVRVRVLVLVNGSPEKTNGVRVRALFRDMAKHHDIQIRYRDDDRKLTSTIGFYLTARRMTPHVIYVEGIGYAGIVAALAAKVLHGSRMILSTGDVGYEFAKSSMGPLRAEFMRLMESAALRMSDAIVVWGPYHQKILQERGFHNVFWIPGGVDTALFRPMECADLRRRLGLEGRLTIGVVGSIHFNKRHQFCYGWEVVEAVRLLKGLPVAGVVVGTGNGVPFLQELAARYGVSDQVIFTGWVDHDTLPQYVNLIDVCISTQSNDLVGEVRITAKVPEYLACGRYIVASNVGGAREFVQQSGRLLECDGVKDLRYVEALAQEVKRILADRSVMALGRNGVSVAKKYFDYSVLRPKVQRVLELVTSGPASGLQPTSPTRTRS